MQCKITPGISMSAWLLLAVAMFAAPHGWAAEANAPAVNDKAPTNVSSPADPVPAGNTGVNPPSTRTAEEKSSAAARVVTSESKNLQKAAIPIPPAAGKVECWMWVVSGVVLCGIAGLLIASARQAKATTISALPTSFFFWLGIGYLLVLLLVGVFYALATARSDDTMMIGRLLPVAVPWFGALGAVTISLAGVFFYSDQGWNSKYNYWHIGRPLFGAVLGTVAFFIFILIVSSSGSTIPIFETKPKPEPKDFIIYYVLAFLVGYREETFRDLIQRVTDLILKPGTPSVGVPQVIFKVNGLETTVLDFGNTTAGTAAMQTVDIENGGSQTLSAPIASLDAAVNSPFAITVNSLAGIKELKPGGAATLTVTFKPAAAGGFSTRLTIKGSNLSSGAQLPVKGVGQ